MSDDAAMCAMWAQEQITEAVRYLPLVGALTHRTTVHSLAQVDQGHGEIAITDSLCRVNVESTGGVSLDMDVVALRRAPRVVSRFFAAEGGLWVSDPWTAGWGTADLDGDGRPGLNVGVNAPICSGSLDVISTTFSLATARSAQGGLSGAVRTYIDRTVPWASNPCLGLVRRHTTESVQGTFAWTPVPAGSTCDTLESAGWPVHAPTAAQLQLPAPNSPAPAP